LSQKKPKTKKQTNKKNPKKTKKTKQKKPKTTTKAKNQQKMVHLIFDFRPWVEKEERRPLLTPNSPAGLPAGKMEETSSSLPL